MEERILTKYLRGEADPKEIEKVLLWVESSEENLEQLRFMRATLEASLIGFDTLLESKSEAPTKPQRRFGRAGFSPVWIFATVVALALLLFIPIVKRSQSDVSVQRVCAPVGQQMKVDLSDGTVVWLNSNSELEFSDHGWKRVRKVTLRGEAYFEVAGNEKRPFIVSTPEFNVKVLGTKFNVNTYYSKQSVVLVDGAVDIIHDKDTYSLLPGDLFTVDTTNRDRSITKVDTKNYIAWTNGYLEFSSSSLEHVLSQIQSFFGATFEYDNAKASNTYLSGKLELRAGLKNALEGLKNSNAIRYSMRDSSSVSIKIL